MWYIHRSTDASAFSCKEKWSRDAFWKFSLMENHDPALGRLLQTRLHWPWKCRCPLPSRFHLFWRCYLVAGLLVHTEVLFLSSKGISIFYPQLGYSFASAAAEGKGSVSFSISPARFFFWLLAHMGVLSEYGQESVLSSGTGVTQGVRNGA